ncbi:hypothetical protein niasHS_016024 [Heterodera schachtii]|uniref:Uncharacterized protein n=1 Tax=Heterodera schachtii TaxID=97005 RepID=A0ABD2HXR6_HETSC
MLLLYFCASQDFAFFKETHRQLVESNGYYEEGIKQPVAMFCQRSKTPQYVFAIAHTKKMQQVFTKPDMVERFFPDPKEAHIVEAIRKKVYENPQNYVLKTNECGTPNTRLFFNDDIPKKFAQMTPAEHNYCCIIEKLHPMVIKNHFVCPKIGFTANLDVTPELGIYGCLIGNTITGEVSYVSRFGHTMKSKTA